MFSAVEESFLFGGGTMKKLLVFIGLITVSMMMMTGCSGEKTVKIGAILPLSGPLASIGKDIKCAINVGVKHLNANGGIRNKPVEVFFEDSLGLPDKGKEAYIRLVREKGVHIIVGAVSSEVTLSLAPLAKKYEVPIISPTSSSPKLTKQGNDYTFRVYPSDTIEARRISDTMFNQLFIRKFIPIAIKNEYGYGISNEVIRIARGTQAMNIPEVIRYSPDSTYEDFLAIAEKVNALDPEAILIAGYPEDSAQLLKALHEVKAKTYIFITSSGSREDFLKSTGEAAVGVIYAKAPFNPKATDEKTRKFVGDYVDICGKTPGVYAAHGYDAVTIAGKAFSKSSRPDDILRRLQQVKQFKGVSGDITFDRYGDVVQYPKIFRVRAIEDGELKCTLLTDEDKAQIKDSVLKVK